MGRALLPATLPSDHSISGYAVCFPVIGLRLFISNINHKGGVLTSHNIWRIMIELNLGIVFWAGMEVGKRWWPRRFLDLGVSLARKLKECVSQGHVQFCLSTKSAVAAPSIPALAGLFSTFLGMLMEAVCWLAEHVALKSGLSSSQFWRWLTTWP